MTTILPANGIRLCCDSIGDPHADPVLLIAGLGTQMIRWTPPFCAALAARGYRVIRFDNRDAGCSTHLPGVAYTLHNMARDAIGLLDALGIAHAHVVGRSMGGMIAQIAAATHPDRVRSLTSIMSSTGNPALPAAAPDVMVLLTRPGPDPTADPAGSMAHALAFARRIAGSAHPFDEEAQRAIILAEAARARDPSGFGRQLAAIAAAGDLRPLLARITVPTLVVHGVDDPLVPVACGRDTAAAIPGAELLLVEGMGHELPPPLYDAVTDAIDRVARRAAAYR
jgi:pimeloyl-ACP methyl ester carboxylesterase